MKCIYRYSVSWTHPHQLLLLTLLAYYSHVVLALSIWVFLCIRVEIPVSGRQEKVQGKAGGWEYLNQQFYVHTVNCWWLSQISLFSLREALNVNTIFISIVSVSLGLFAWEKSKYFYKCKPSKLLLCTCMCYTLVEVEAGRGPSGPLTCVLGLLACKYLTIVNGPALTERWLLWHYSSWYVIATDI